MQIDIAASRMQANGVGQIVCMSHFARRQGTGGRRQKTGDRRQAGGRRQKAGDRRRETGGRKQETGRQEAGDQTNDDSGR
jgi:hypothetical protein